MDEKISKTFGCHPFCFLFSLSDSEKQKRIEKIKGLIANVSRKWPANFRRMGQNATLLKEIGEVQENHKVKQQEMTNEL